MKCNTATKTVFGRVCSFWDGRFLGAVLHPPTKKNWKTVAPWLSRVDIAVVTLFLLRT